jgi:hypothetical protein
MMGRMKRCKRTSYDSSLPVLNKRAKRDHKTEPLSAAHELLKDLEYVLAGMMAEQGRARQRT